MDVSIKGLVSCVLWRAFRLVPRDQGCSAEQRGKEVVVVVAAAVAHSGPGCHCGCGCCGRHNTADRLAS